MLDGRYQMADSSGRDTIYTPTPAERARLQTILAWAQEEITKPSVDPGRVAHRLEQGLERNAPSLLDRFRSLLRSKELQGAGVLLALLMGIISTIVAGNSGISADDLERILDSVHDHQLAPQEQPAPSPPADRIPSVPAPQPGRIEPDQQS